MSKPMPASAMDYYLPAMRRLVALCRELQLAAKDGTFFLTCRDAGMLLGITYQAANNWLTKLTMDKVLLCVKKGVFNPHGKGKANEYRYIGR
jgi:hypothetical protein